MRIGDENRMPDLKQDWDRHALILTKMRIGDENRMPDLKQDEDRGLMGCLILSKIRLGML